LPTPLSQVWESPFWDQFHLGCVPQGLSGGGLRRNLTPVERRAGAGRAAIGEEGGEGHLGPGRAAVVAEPGGVVRPAGGAPPLPIQEGRARSRPDAKRPRQSSLWVRNDRVRRDAPVSPGGQRVLTLRLRRTTDDQGDQTQAARSECLRQMLDAPLH